MIKYGDVEYFRLLELQDLLTAWSKAKLDLISLDRLRTEVQIKIETIHLEHKKINHGR